MGFIATILSCLSAFQILLFSPKIMNRIENANIHVRTGLTMFLIISFLISIVFIMIIIRIAVLNRERLDQRVEFELYILKKDGVIDNIIRIFSYFAIIYLFNYYFNLPKTAYLWERTFIISFSIMIFFYSIYFLDLRKLRREKYRNYC
ncbi:hypothetical protein WG909_05715 [Peptostreptococcaceae bacterium AGR-M142]